MGDESTPIDGRPHSESAFCGMTGNGDRFVTIYDPNTGVISEFVGATDVTGEDAADEEEGDEHSRPLPSTVSFKYHVSDVFTVNQRAGTTAGPDQNRAKVTSSSDGVGEWVEITEVAAIG